MNNNSSTQYHQNEPEKEEDIKAIILQYLRYWPWFVICVIISLGISFIFLKYATNIYTTNSKIKVLKEQEGLDLSGLQGSSPLIDMSKVNLENEIQILKSRRLSKKIIQTLNLETQYYKLGTLKASEVWGHQIPFTVNWSIDDSAQYRSTPLLNLKFTSQSNFKVTEEESGFSASLDAGDTLQFENTKAIIDINPYYKGDYTELTGSIYSFKKHNLENLTTSLSNKIKAEAVEARADIINISLNGENQTKNEAILDELMRQFNQDGIDDNRVVAKRTGEFIKERLKYLVEELDTVETAIVNFKSDNELVDIEASTEALFGKYSETEMRVFEVETQLEITKNFRNILVKNTEIDLLPANLGIENANVNALTGAYNQLVNERNNILVTATPQNPTIIAINDRLEAIKRNIINSVDNYINNLETSLQNTARRESSFNSRLEKLPGQSKEIRSIERERLIKEKLFLFLLQKREEAALTYAITAPVIKTVDYAYTNPMPVSPKRKIIMLGGLIVGLIIPFGVLYLKFLFNTKLNSVDVLKSNLKEIPILGEIPENEAKTFKLITPNDRSALAESFRILRTNINFIKVSGQTQENKQQVIYVTSSTKGEGKTYVALNLATVMSSKSKKVLLVGCDLRNPQIHSYIGLNKNTKGLSNYLYNPNINFEDIRISNINGSHLDLILSGDIPPNPSEILTSDRFETFIEEARSKYDYVIIDTAPTILVTDTIMISQYADVTLYLTRAGYTDIRLIEHIKDLNKHHKLKNIGIVMNGLVEKGAYTYNYGYGYGYNEHAEKSSPKWKFWQK
ncbi:GumC family protein [Psychroflexus sp. ALD_RP9]|uniref:GumC family protein n=1 Tax=Psychroflexus sp. ALD_RP9 TaxID=2777186 RepID=UPI001A8C8C9B|nr:tyrosine-protein kinase [Psychroflexus sp. ALD_RP9]QSS98005.1 polysaccharide biosynthesis tyrosine autokinase [Psychroflexus sp. ALD_RP9]